MIKLSNLVVKMQTQNDCWKDGRMLPSVKGILVHSTATPGVNARTFSERWNRPGIEKAVHAFIDDIEIIQNYPWDKRTWHSGYNPNTGKRANDTHIGFEICEPPGHTYNGGQMVNYNPVKYASYFNMAYNNAINFCAYICQMFNLDPLEPGVIIDHSEGYKLGVASNHSDVMHWFPYHGKNMDIFRKDVADLLEKDKRETNDNTPDNYAKEAIDWAVANNILKGDLSGNYMLHSNITRQDAIVFMKRVYDLIK